MSSVEPAATAGLCKVHNFLLGVIPEASFARGRMELRAGDVLLAYSDGILESRNNADQEFGHERLEAQLRRARTGSADGVLFSVLGAVQDFAAPRRLVDDTSLVAMRRRNPQDNAWLQEKVGKETFLK